MFSKSESTLATSPRTPVPTGPGPEGPARSPGEGRDGRTVYRKRVAGWLLVPALSVVAVFESCQTVPITGRRTTNLFSVAEDDQLGAEAYGQILEGERLVTSGPDHEMVHRIMDRIVAVAEDPGYDWEVSLIDNDQVVNAFALPGGKMAVYTGILPVAQTEAGLAVVMGHEIGHVVARHGTERMTQSMGVDLVLTYLDIGDYEVLARNLVSLTFELPFSRKHELEADHIGLIYMARAGYDPREAVAFWKRMSAGGGAPPEWLSTHPSDEHRVEELEALLPEALQEWQGAR